jgi:hypothetical protein
VERQDSAIEALYDDGPLQAKLAVSQPTDRSEREAERVAEALVSQDDSAMERRDVDVVDAVDAIDRQTATGTDATVDGETEAEIRSVTGGGRPLSASERSFFEPRFKRDFSDVRVHTGPGADEAARSINAEAFTIGSDIAFARGNYHPGTRRGKELLAHELTHVRQSTGGRVSLLPKADVDQLASVPTAGTGVHVQAKLEVSSPDDPAEREAERVARAVEQDQRVTAHRGAGTHVQRQQRAEQGGPSMSRSGSSDRSGKSAESDDDENKSIAIPEDQAIDLVAMVLRQRGIVAPEGYTLEGLYLQAMNSGIWLLLAADGTPVPPAEWVNDNVTQEGVAWGGQRLVTVRISDYGHDHYLVRVAEITVETGAIEQLTHRTVERDLLAVGEAISTSLDDLERGGLTIREPTTAAWKPSPRDERETDGSEGDGGDTGAETDGADSDAGSSESGTGEGSGGTKAEGTAESGEREEDGGTGEDIRYVVEEGDTLWDIARAYDVEGGWRALWNYKDNRSVIGDDPDLIHPGDEIKVPTDSAWAESDGESSTSLGSAD